MAWQNFPALAAVSISKAWPTTSPSLTTTAIIRWKFAPHWKPRKFASLIACWCSSSRIAIRARSISGMNSAAHSIWPTFWCSPIFTPPAKRPSMASPAKRWATPFANPATNRFFTTRPCRLASSACWRKPGLATPSSLSAQATSVAPATKFSRYCERSVQRNMRIEDKKVLGTLSDLGVELKSDASLTDITYLGIGGTTDLLRLTRHESIPEVVKLLEANGIPFKFLGGGSNLLVADNELPWVVMQLAQPAPDVVIEGNIATVDAAADLGKTVTLCAKHDLGGMEGLIGVPGTVGGALRMNAGAYGIQIGNYVREVKVYRGGARIIETLKGDQISFEYRHTSFAPDDMMVAVKLELPSKPFREILQGIRICNEKRRASQPLGQKSAGCIFKNPPGASAGRMIDELGLKGLSVGDARVSDRHANFFLNAGRASAKDMLTLIADVRERVQQAYGVSLENEVVVWNA